MKRVPYEEGSWFGVPLTRGGLGVGVVARIGRRGVLLGYFFGPKRAAPPQIGELEQLSPSRAVLVRLFGDLGLIDRSWPVIGKAAGWNRSDWPLPAFGRLEDFTSRALRVEYAEEDLLTELREVPITLAELKRLPPDGLSGAGALETRLTMILDPDTHQAMKED